MRRLFVVLMLWGVAACGDSSLYQGREATSRGKFGPTWPLSVDSGELRCEGREGSRNITFATGGEVYALNARARGRGGVDLDPIWAADPVNPGRQKDLGPLIERALRLCVPPSPQPPQGPPPPAVVPTESARTPAPAGPDTETPPPASSRPAPSPAPS